MSKHAYGQKLPPEVQRKIEAAKGRIKGMLSTITARPGDWVGYYTAEKDAIVNTLLDKTDKELRVLAASARNLDGAVLDEKLDAVVGGVSFVIKAVQTFVMDNSKGGLSGIGIEESAKRADKYFDDNIALLMQAGFDQVTDAERRIAVAAARAETERIEARIALEETVRKEIAAKEAQNERRKHTAREAARAAADARREAARAAADARREAARVAKAAADARREAARVAKAAADAMAVVRRERFSTPPSYDALPTVSVEVREYVAGEMLNIDNLLDPDNPTVRDIYKKAEVLQGIQDQFVLVCERHKSSSAETKNELSKLDKRLESAHNTLEALRAGEVTQAVQHGAPPPAAAAAAIAELASKTKAAASIQALVRGRAGRKLAAVKKILEEHKFEQNERLIRAREQEAAVAAKKLQAKSEVVQTLLERKSLLEAGMARRIAERDKRISDSKARVLAKAEAEAEAVAEQIRQARSEAATSIQAVARAKAARKKYNTLRSASEKIKGALRVNVAKKKLKALRETAVVATKQKASTKLQALVRGRAGRKLAATARSAALKVREAREAEARSVIQSTVIGDRMATSIAKARAAEAQATATKIAAQATKDAEFARAQEKTVAARADKAKAAKIKITQTMAAQKVRMAIVVPKVKAAALQMEIKRASRAKDARTDKAVQALEAEQKAKKTKRIAVEQAKLKKMNAFVEKSKKRVAAVKKVTPEAKAEALKAAQDKRVAKTRAVATKEATRVRVAAVLGVANATKEAKFQKINEKQAAADARIAEQLSARNRKFETVAKKRSAAAERAKVAKASTKLQALVRGRAGRKLAADERKRQETERKIKQEAQEAAIAITRARAHREAIANASARGKNEREQTATAAQAKVQSAFDAEQGDRKKARFAISAERIAEQRRQALGMESAQTIRLQRRLANLRKTHTADMQDAARDTHDTPFFEVLHTEPTKPAVAAAAPVAKISDLSDLESRLHNLNPRRDMTITAEGAAQTVAPFVATNTLPPLPTAESRAAAKAKIIREEEAFIALENEMDQSLESYVHKDDNLHGMPVLHSELQSRFDAVRKLVAVSEKTKEVKIEDMAFPAVPTTHAQTVSQEQRPSTTRQPVAIAIEVGTPSRLKPPAITKSAEPAVAAAAPVAERNMIFTAKEAATTVAPSVAQPHSALLKDLTADSGHSHDGLSVSDAEAMPIAPQAPAQAPPPPSSQTNKIDYLKERLLALRNTDVVALEAQEPPPYTLDDLPPAPHATELNAPAPTIAEQEEALLRRLAILSPDNKVEQLSRTSDSVISSVTADTFSAVDKLMHAPQTAEVVAANAETEARLQQSFLALVDNKPTAVIRLAENADSRICAFGQSYERRIKLLRETQEELQKSLKNKTTGESADTLIATANKKADTILKGWREELQSIRQYEKSKEFSEEIASYERIMSQAQRNVILREIEMPVAPETPLTHTYIQKTAFDKLHQDVFVAIKDTNQNLKQELGKRTSTPADAMRKKKAKDKARIKVIQKLQRWNAAVIDLVTNRDHSEIQEEILKKHSSMIELVKLIHPEYAVELQENLLDARRSAADPQSAASVYNARRRFLDEKDSQLLAKGAGSIAGVGKIFAEEEQKELTRAVEAKTGRVQSAISKLEKDLQSKPQEISLSDLLRNNNQSGLQDNTQTSDQTILEEKTKSEALPKSPKAPSTKTKYQIFKEKRHQAAKIINVGAKSEKDKAEYIKKLITSEPAIDSTQKAAAHIAFGWQKKHGRA